MPHSATSPFNCSLSGSSDGLRSGSALATDENLGWDAASGRTVPPGLLSRVDTNTLLGKQIDKERAGLVALGREGGLVVLVLLHALDVLIEEVGRVHGATLGLGMELGAEDRTRGVDETLVGLIVQVGEVLTPVTGQRGGVDGVTVVLGGDVALASSQVQSGDVVGTVAVLELDRLGTSSESKELVTHADAHDGDLRGLHQLAQVVDGLSAVSRVTGAIGDEDAVKVVSDLVDGVVEGESGYADTTSNKAAENVLLDTAVDQGNVHVTELRAHVEGSLGADATDKVDGLGVNESLVLVGVILLANSDAGKGGTLLTEECDNLAGVDTRDGRNALAGAPLSQRLNGGPVAVLESVILDDDAGALDVGGLEVAEQTVFVTGGRGYTVVPNQGLREDKNLSTVGGVGHGLGVANEGRGEDGLARHVDLGTERLALEDRTVLLRVSCESNGVQRDKRTLMVKVARSLQTGVARRAGAGTMRGVFCCTVAMKRTWDLDSCPRTDRPAEGLRMWESILGGGLLWLGVR